MAHYQNLLPFVQGLDVGEGLADLDAQVPQIEQGVLRIG
jgi:hypothetical protein